MENSKILNFLPSAHRSAKQMTIWASGVCCKHMGKFDLEHVRPFLGHISQKWTKTQKRLIVERMVENLGLGSVCGLWKAYGTIDLDHVKVIWGTFGALFS